MVLGAESPCEPCGRIPIPAVDAHAAPRSGALANAIAIAIATVIAPVRLRAVIEQGLDVELPVFTFVLALVVISISAERTMVRARDLDQRRRA